MSSVDSYSVADVTTLNTHRTPIQKQPEALLCLVGLSRSYFLGDDVYPTFFYDDDRDMYLFNLLSTLNPTRVKTGTRPRAAHEVPLLTATASRVIDMENTTRGGTKDQVRDRLSHELPPVENATTTKVVLEPGLEMEVASIGPLVNKRRRKRGNNESKANAPPKVLRKDHATFRPAQSTLGGKSLAPMGLDVGSTFSTPATQDVSTAAKSVSDPDPSSKKTATVIPIGNIATTNVQGQFSANSLESGKSISFPSMDGSPGGISNLQAQGTGEEKIKAAFKEFKKYEDDRVEQRCAEMDARLDNLSVDFDEELYPIEHGKADRDLAAIEAYDPEADSKYVKALQDLKDLKYPLVDQLERD
nr:transposase (putative), gypsy type [Tanacetum cinerariifolium]